VPRGTTTWSDYVSVLSWSRLGVELAELSGIAVHREVFIVLLGMPPPHDPSQMKIGHENE